MEIEYRQTKDFTIVELKRLFMSVNWESGKYPEKLVRAMHNSTRVISAWDGNRLVGLVRALDDGETIAFLHYLLVEPAYQGHHIGDELMKRIMVFSNITTTLQWYENVIYKPSNSDLSEYRYASRAHCRFQQGEKEHSEKRGKTK